MLTVTHGRMNIEYTDIRMDILAEWFIKTAALFKFMLATDGIVCKTAGVYRCQCCGSAPEEKNPDPFLNFNPSGLGWI